MKNTNQAPYEMKFRTLTIEIKRGNPFWLPLPKGFGFYAVECRTDNHGVAAIYCDLYEEGELVGMVSALPSTEDDIYFLASSPRMTDFCGSVKSFVEWLEEVHPIEGFIDLE